MKSQKLQARAYEGILVGYEGTHNYRVWNPVTRKVATTPHVVFHEQYNDDFDEHTDGESQAADDSFNVHRSFPPWVQRRQGKKPPEIDLRDEAEDEADGEAGGEAANTLANFGAVYRLTMWDICQLTDENPCAGPGGAADRQRVIFEYAPAHAFSTTTEDDLVTAKSTTG